MRAGRTIEEDAQKILSIFITYQTLKRKQIVLYSEFSDRKVRDLIKYVRTEMLPSVRGETIIYNPSTRFYEYTDDDEKIEMYSRFLLSYMNELQIDLNALRKAGKRNAERVKTDKQLTMEF